jgi:hypothetical protein
LFESREKEVAAGDLDEAEKDFSKVTTLDPKSTELTGLSYYREPNHTAATCHEFTKSPISPRLSQYLPGPLLARTKS